jgi:NDP-sugar pyrophosphorylase family protein
MTSPALIVMAAGMGTRYGGLKQIDPVGPGQETILDYSIYDAQRAGFGKLVFVIRKEIEQPFRQTIGARFEKRIAVEYVFQELYNLPLGFSVPTGRSKPWGTAHAVLVASSAIDEPFAVINADDFYGAEGYRLLAGHLQSDMADYAMAGFVLRNTLSEFGAVARGVCQLSRDKFLERVDELTGIERDGEGGKNIDTAGHVTRLTGDEVVSMNMWGFTPSVFEWLKEYFVKFLERSGSNMHSECFLPSAINELVITKRARVKVLQTKDSWFGVTYREDHSRVVKNIERLIQSGYYPERLWS